MLQINPDKADTFGVDKATTDAKTVMMDEEYIYLTKDLGWKEGLNEELEEEEFKSDPKDATKLSNYLFLTKQMCWKKGLKALREKEDEAIETKLQQTMIWKGSHQDTGTSLPKKKESEL